jgi:UDP-N-acetylglucosamine 4-epimerase
LIAYETIKRRLQESPRTWLVTGVAGFIGSNLLESLLKLGQRVVGLDNFSTGRQRNLDEVQSRVSRGQWRDFVLVRGDIRDIESCRFACRGVDFVLHHAAMGSVPLSIEDPINANDINVNGFINILVAARDAGAKRLVYASSSSLYGDQNRVPNQESSIGRLLSPYAVTKRINELYSDVFLLVSNFSSIGLRYFNVFGRRQDPDGPYAAVIPRWIAAMVNGEPVFINGDGESTRDFCYVENAVQANVLAATVANNDAAGQIYNVGYGESTSLNALYLILRNQLISRNAVLSEPIAYYRDFRPGDVRHSLADISKAKALLGYLPSHGPETGLNEAIDWYLEHFKPS